MSHAVRSTGLSLGKSARDLACQVHDLAGPLSTLYLQAWHREEKIVGRKLLNCHLFLTKSHWESWGFT